jgi:hypothetical protein
MIRQNCIVKIQRLTGDENNKNYQDLATNVYILIEPASNETAVMYEVPVGQSYSFMIMDQVDWIRPGDKIIVLDPQTSGLAVNDQLIVRGNAQKSYVLGHIFNSGVAVKT